MSSIEHILALRPTQCWLNNWTCFTALQLILWKNKWRLNKIINSAFSHRTKKQRRRKKRKMYPSKNVLRICVFNVSTSKKNNFMIERINKSSFNQEMWIYCRCHSCQCLYAGCINGCRAWRKVWNALNEAPYLSFFGPTNAHHPSGCLASLFEHHGSCGMTCQLLKFIWSYLQLTCDLVKTGT